VSPQLQEEDSAKWIIPFDVFTVTPTFEAILFSSLKLSVTVEEIAPALTTITKLSKRIIGKDIFRD
jgi:hypothetical protein